MRFSCVIDEAAIHQQRSGRAFVQQQKARVMFGTISGAAEEFGAAEDDEGALHALK